MNRKGISALVTIPIAVVIIILALVFAGPIKSFADNAMNQTTTDGTPGLDCDNSTISDYNKGGCIVVDLFNPAFVGILIGLAALVLLAKIAFSG